MRIKIGHKLITEPIVNILQQVQKELTNGKLKDIDASNSSNILITCPCHKDGFERRPSCRILADTDCDLEAGYAHCFSCGYSGPLAQVIGDLFDADKSFGEEWLVEHYGNVFVEEEEYLPPIEISKQVLPKSYMSETDLEAYDYYHPYMWQRKLSKSVVDRFRVGYDKMRNMITFPVYDERHNLVMVTGRSVTSHFFHIPKNVEKPLYLMYDILENKFPTIIVTEAQLDALTAWSYGFPAVATMGVPSDKQFETLNRCGVTTFITMFDNDASGFKFTQRFNNNIRKDVFVYNVTFPLNRKDINDLSFDEFWSCLNSVGIFSGYNF